MEELHHILIGLVAENKRLREDNARLGIKPIDIALQEYMKRKLQIGMITELRCSCEMNALLRNGCKCGGS